MRNFAVLLSLCLMVVVSCGGDRIYIYPTNPVVEIDEKCVPQAKHPIVVDEVLECNQEQADEFCQSLGFLRAYKFRCTETEITQVRCTDCP